MRLIDADALKKLRHDYIQGRIKFDGNEYDLIDKCPTIDAVSVVHGRWEYTHPFETLFCSNCRQIPRTQYESEYCPKCGARMDGE